MLLLIVFLAFIGFILYLIIDLVATNPNLFFNKWTKKTLWMWLPFYALWRLTREIFLDKR